MALDSNISDPNAPNGAGSDAGQQTPPGAGDTQDPGAAGASQPAARTYSDADMANLRRSEEAKFERKIAHLQQEFEQRYMPKPEPKIDDPWSALDPNVADVLRKIFESEFGTRLSPLTDQARDTAFRSEESEAKAKYKDYEPNRTAILEFAVQNKIPNLEVAYHAWRSQTQWKDPSEIGKQAIADWQKKKAKDASQTPSVEGRGGGAPPSKQTYKDNDERDEAARALFRSAQESSA